MSQFSFCRNPLSEKPGGWTGTFHTGLSSLLTFYTGLSSRYMDWPSLLKNYFETEWLQKPICQGAEQLPFFAEVTSVLVLMLWEMLNAVSSQALAPMAGSWTHTIYRGHKMKGTSRDDCSFYRTIHAPGHMMASWMADKICYEIKWRWVFSAQAPGRNNVCDVGNKQQPLKSCGVEVAVSSSFVFIHKRTHSYIWAE